MYVSYVNILYNIGKKGVLMHRNFALIWLLLTCWVALRQAAQVTNLQSLPNIVKVLEKVMKP